MWMNPMPYYTCVQSINNLCHQGTIYREATVAVRGNALLCCAVCPPSEVSFLHHNEWMNEKRNPSVFFCNEWMAVVASSQWQADGRTILLAVLTKFRVLPLLPHPAPGGAWMTALFLFLSPGAVSVSQSASRERRAEVRASLITPTSLLLPPPSLSLFPKIAVSRDQLVLEREREGEREKGLYYCLESEKGLWIDTNSHPRQANPSAGWINVLLFLGAPCFQGRPNDAMTSMRVNRRLEELSGFHLGLLQYFLQKGWKRVQNGSIFSPKCIENRGESKCRSDNDHSGITSPQPSEHQR